MITSGDISSGHARALLGLDSASAQIQLAKRVVKKSLSVRQVEKLVGLREVTATTQKAAGSARQLDPNIRAAVLELERALGTRVKILGDGKRGKIEISYFSAEDLNRLYDWIARR
jgi:ParB family chromosome partitioning protein